MHQWIIRFPEFTEFLIHLGKIPLRYIYQYILAISSCESCLLYILISSTLALLYLPPWDSLQPITTRPVPLAFGPGVISVLVPIWLSSTYPVIPCPTPWYTIATCAQPGGLGASTRYQPSVWSIATLQQRKKQQKYVIKTTFLNRHSAYTDIAKCTNP